MIGNKIRELRKKHSLTLDELANNLNNLNKIKMGDKVQVISKDKLRTYEVSKLYDVATTQVEILEQHKDHLKFNFEQGTNHLLHVANALEELNLSYVRLYSEQPSLDDVFLAYTGKGLRDS